MSRTIAFAVLVGALGSAAVAAPQRQLVAPNFNPGLRTVPFVHQSHSTADGAACAQQLVSRVDSGTVIAGPNGRVVHITGMADAGISVAELAITSVSRDGRSATADFLVCTSPTWASTSPVSAAMSLNAHAGVESIAVRTQSNAITLKVR